MEKNVSSVAEQDKTAEVKKNPKLIELARPYKFDDKEYTEIDLSGLDDLTIKDAVLIIKKLYNEGEMAVMITPETATAYTDALAAAATKLPIEFFQLLPIGASKKVRQTVQASLRSAAAEEDGDEDEHSHIMKFGKPYTYKGEKYTEVDLSGVANLTGIHLHPTETAEALRSLYLPRTSQSLVMQTARRLLRLWRTSTKSSKPLWTNTTEKTIEPGMHKEVA